MTFKDQVDRTIIQAHVENLLNEFGRRWTESQLEELVDIVSEVTIFTRDNKPISEKLDDEIWFSMRTLERKWAC